MSIDRQSALFATTPNNARRGLAEICVIYARLDEVTERWDVKVTNFEILKIAVDEHRKEIDDANFIV